MIDYAKKRLTYLTKVRPSIQNAINSAPEGRLKICGYGKSGPHFYISYKDKQAYLSYKEAGPLATKRYHIYALKAVDREIRALNLYLNHMPEVKLEEVLDSMPGPLKPLITPAVMTNEQYAQQWQAQPFTPKGFKSNDDSAYYTKKGERVRSKSEILIADMLFDLGIPYKYEKPLLLSGGKHLFHPDFSILKVSTREEVYLEHLGKMDDDGYTDDFAYKYRIYMSNGIYLGQKLFLTCESGSAPLDNRLIKEFLIKTFK